jgi:hypothetical protein
MSVREPLSDPAPLHPDTCPALHVSPPPSTYGSGGYSRRSERDALERDRSVFGVPTYTSHYTSEHEQPRLMSCVPQKLYGIGTIDV